MPQARGTFYDAFKTKENNVHSKREHDTKHFLKVTSVVLINLPISSPPSPFNSTTLKSIYIIPTKNLL